MEFNSLNSVWTDFHCHMLLRATCDSGCETRRSCHCSENFSLCTCCVACCELFYQNISTTGGLHFFLRLITNKYRNSSIFRLCELKANKTLELFTSKILGIPNLEHCMYFLLSSRFCNKQNYQTSI